MKSCEPAPVAKAPTGGAGTGEHLAATGGVSPLLGLGGLLAVVDGVLLVRRRWS